MKRTFTLTTITCLIYSMTCAQVQQLSNWEECTRAVRNMNAVNVAGSHKTTAIKQRLVGLGRTMSASNTPDTTMYFYDFGRGSEFDYYEMSYNIFPTPPNIYGQKLIMYDSISQQGFGMGYPHLYSMKYTNHHLLLSYFEHTPGYTTGAKWLYDAQGRAMVMALERLINGVWEPMANHYYTYDAMGRLVIDSLDWYVSGTWLPRENFTYSYNSAGLIDTVDRRLYLLPPTSMARERHFFTYTGTNMVSDITQLYSGTSWVNASKSEMTYAGNQKAGENGFSWTNGNWVHDKEEIRFLNNDNLPDSIVTYTNYQSGPDTSIATVVYNSFNNPTRISYYGKSMKFQTEHRYYYQEYDPLQINNTMQAKTLTVYPNPAKEQLTVAAGELQKGHAGYTITDMMGTQVLRGEGAVQAGSMTLDISALQPGMYWLQLRDGEKQAYTTGFVKE